MSFEFHYWGKFMRLDRNVHSLVIYVNSHFFLVVLTFVQIVKFIDKMSLGVRALSGKACSTKGEHCLGAEVAMLTKRAPATQYRHIESFGGILTITHTYLPEGGRKVGEKPADISNGEFAMIRKNQQSETGKAEICNHI